MPSVIALKGFRYAKRNYNPGDTVPAKNSKHVAMLVKAGVAKAMAQPLVYQTRHLEAARTVPELRADCEAKGIDLPKGYIPKSELTRILSEC